MANEAITTALGTSYFLDDLDNLYIAATGSILALNADALALRTSNAREVVVAIEGHVTSVGGSAIDFINTATERFHQVLIGTTGVVTSVGLGLAAIRLETTDCDVINAGSVSGSIDGIEITGDLSSVTNSGVVTAGAFAIHNFGVSNLVTNSGQISSRYGISLSGDQSVVSNSGTISATTTSSFQNNAGIGQHGFTTASAQNSGEIRVIGQAAILAQSLVAVGAQYDLTNSGTISSDATALVLQLQGRGNNGSVVNSGEISGKTGGLDASVAALHLSNLADGTISGTRGFGLLVAGVLDLVNDGVIAASGPSARAVVLGSGSGFSLLVNNGTISATFGSAIDATLTQAGFAVTLRNFGDISGRYDGSGIADLVSNRGTMDAVNGFAGNDAIRNHGLIDGVVLMGDGNDSYHGRLGEVTLMIDAGTGDDTVLGGVGDETILGGMGNDLLDGGAGNDVLTGSARFDLLIGGLGNDTLVAGADRDTLVGGAGADVFGFGSAVEIGLTAQSDRITNFAADDAVDVSGFMAGAHFIGAAAFTASGGSEIRYVAGTVFGDVNGDGVTDWSLILSNKFAVTAADFLV